MIIFLNEEGSYLSWVVHHPTGFVLDWLRKPTRKQPVIHRAKCSAIRRSKSKRTHWTTGRHGQTHWPTVADELKRSGYQGDICITAEYSDHDQTDRFAAEDVAFIKSLF